MRREIERLARRLDRLRRIRPGETDPRHGDQQLDTEQSVAARDRVQQPGLGLAERRLRIAFGEEVARGEEVRLDDVLHVAGSRGPVADLVEAGRGVAALGEVDAGEKGVEARVVPAVCACHSKAVIAEGAGGGEVAEVDMVTGVGGTPLRVEGFSF